MSDVGVELRLATVDDVQNLAGVQLASALAGFSHIFPSEIPKPTQAELETEWRALLGDPTRTIDVAAVDGEPVGAVVYGEDRDPQFATDAYLLKLYVLPDHAGRGIGDRLHDNALADLRSHGFQRVRLWVLERNLVARRMYERRGWKLQHWSRTDWPGSGILELGYMLELNESTAV